MAPIQRGSNGGEGSHPVNALKNELSKTTHLHLLLYIVGCVGLHDYWYTAISNIYGQPQRPTKDRNAAVI